MDKTSFVASKELSEKIEKLREELKLDSPGEVISLGLSMLEMSLGRKVEFTDGEKKWEVNKFKNHNQTILIDDGEQK